ncbi:hypothetical protein [Mycobacterium sp. M26]|uniref:hypothetical protein n=1 Tax=Mycobacterium sp. M26 TaxID=1762962 RepID=UPI001E49EB75|nr:hypothetical protein [Mycobacterium sp. M26]
MTLTRTLAGALIAGIGAASTLWLTAAGGDIATAHADNVRCDPACHGTWCPGDPITFRVEALSKSWDANVCHEYHQVSGQPGVYAEGPLPEGTFVCPPWAFMCP